MNGNLYFILSYYDKQVVRRIIDKYGIKPMDALRQFVTSQTHNLLEDEKCALWEYSADSIFELWEVERITGDPRNYSILRGE